MPPCKCNTTDFRLWLSVINGVYEGEIEIHEEDGNGNFTGRHHGHHEDIKGTCTPGGMTFQLPATGGRFRYSGRFVLGTCDIVSGTRVRIGPFAEGEATLVTDDWIGTKPTTLNISRELITGSAGGSTADESAEHSSAGETAAQKPTGE